MRRPALGARRAARGFRSRRPPARAPARSTNRGRKRGGPDRRVRGIARPTGTRGLGGQLARKVWREALNDSNNVVTNRVQFVKGCEGIAEGNCHVEVRSSSDGTDEAGGHTHAENLRIVLE